MSQRSSIPASAPRHVNGMQLADDDDASSLSKAGKHFYRNDAVDSTVVDDGEATSSVVVSMPLEGSATVIAAPASLARFNVDGDAACPPISQATSEAGVKVNSLS